MNDQLQSAFAKLQSAIEQYVKEEVERQVGEKLNVAANDTREKFDFSPQSLSQDSQPQVSPVEDSPRFDLESPVDLSRTEMNTSFNSNSSGAEEQPKPSKNMAWQVLERIKDRKRR